LSATGDPAKPVEGSHRDVLEAYLDLSVGLLGPLDEGDDIVEIKDVMTVHHFLKNVPGLISAAVTSANVVAAEQSALRARIGIKDPLHRAALRNLNSGLHCSLLVPAACEVASSV
jgi:hypothetical protein